MEQILLGYGLPKETVTAIMMLYKNTKANVRSLDGETDFFNSIAEVLQGDTLAPYLFIICLAHILRTSIDLMKKWFYKKKKKKKKKTRSRRYPLESMTDTDYTNDIALLANKHVQTLLLSQEQAARGISLYMNADKTEFLCFKQVAISTFSGKPLKLVEQFTCLGSNISSTESDVNIHVAKWWTSIDKLSIIWISHFSDEMK